VFKSSQLFKQNAEGKRKLAGQKTTRKTNAVITAAFQRNVTGQKIFEEANKKFF